MRRIFIFGTGVGYKKIKELISEDNIELVGFIDNDKSKQDKILDDKKIYSVEDAVKLEFDNILIASIYYDEIESQLLNVGVEKSKIIKYYSPKDNIIDVRLASLKLVYKEITERELQGNVAELGVYKGEFAKYINKLFKDRVLYLFDTFKGFDTRDLEIEHSNKLSVAVSSDFADTNEKVVLDKMPFKEKCVIKKGYFPESLHGLEDKFVFVSLDVDLYKPTYDGLNYFYDRLVEGGYIFIHDYNNISYKGVKKAIKDFALEKHINYFPLSDNSGSAVIMK